MPEGLNPKDQERLQSELTKYAEEGATDDELREFRDVFVSELKKKPQFNTVPTGSDSKTGTPPTSPSKSVYVAKDVIAEGQKPKLQGTENTFSDNSDFTPAAPTVQQIKTKSVVPPPTEKVELQIDPNVSQQLKDVSETAQEDISGITLKPTLNKMTAFEKAVERGKLMGQQADILTVAADEKGIDVNELAMIQQRMNRVQASGAYQKFGQAKTFGETWDALMEDPVGVIGELTSESLTAMITHGMTRMQGGAAAGAALGSVVPGVGTAAGASLGSVAGVGLTSLNLSYSADIISALQESGIDVTNPESLKMAFSDDNKFAEIKSHALKLGVPVALFDMLSAGLAGRIVSKPAKGILKKAGQLLAETGVQSALGAGGEVAGEVVAGDPLNPSAILAEAIGEIGGGAPEIVIGTITHKVKNGQQVSEEELLNAAVSQKEGVDINEVVDVYAGSGQITPEQAQVIKEGVAQYNEVLAKVPDDFDAEKTKKSAELLIEKQRIEQSIEGKDEALVSPQKTRIEEINNELKAIANGNKTGGNAEPTTIGVVEQPETTGVGSETGVSQENVPDRIPAGEEAKVEAGSVGVKSKKAAIERGREEELNKETPVKNENIIVNDGTDNLTFKIITFKDGSTLVRHIKTNETTADNKSKKLITYPTLEDFQNLLKYDFDENAKIIKTELVKDDYTDKQSQEVKATKEKTINAKYDAEYIDKVRKGEFTAQQAKDALKEINRLTPELSKQLDDAELAALETPKAETKNNEQEKDESGTGVQQRQGEGEVTKTEDSLQPTDESKLKGEKGKQEAGSVGVGGDAKYLQKESERKKKDEQAIETLSGDLVRRTGSEGFVFKDGKLVKQSEKNRKSIHFAGSGGGVKSHFLGTWGQYGTSIITGFKDFAKTNGIPRSLALNDVYFYNKKTGEYEFPKSTKILTSDKKLYDQLRSNGYENAEYSEESNKIVKRLKEIEASNKNYNSDSEYQDLLKQNEKIHNEWIGNKKPQKIDNKNKNINLGSLERKHESFSDVRSPRSEADTPFIHSETKEYKEFAGEKDYKEDLSAPIWLLSKEIESIELNDKYKEEHLREFEKKGYEPSLVDMEQLKEQVDSSTHSQIKEFKSLLERFPKLTPNLEYQLDYINDKLSAQSLKETAKAETKNNGKVEAERREKGRQDVLTSPQEDTGGEKPPVVELSPEGKKKTGVEKVKKINGELLSLKKNNPEQFKKDGTPKAKSKIAPAYNALLEAKNAEMQKMADSFKDEFNAIAREESENSRIATQKLNEEFEARQKELEKFIPEGDLQEEKNFDEIERIFDKVKEGELATPEEIAFVNENAWLPNGFVFAQDGLTEESSVTTPAEKQPTKEATSFDKVASASSRFRPYETVVFEKPIVGTNGNKLISYQWAYEWTMQPSKNDTELKSKRISDWTQAESSAETGRDIVHKFTVERKDGTIVTVSSETIPSLLGYVDAKEMKNLPSVVSSVKTLAKQRMQLAILEAQEAEYNAIKKQVNNLPKPKIVPAEIADLPKITQSIVSRDSSALDRVRYWKTDGETKVVYRQEDKSNAPDNTTKEQLLGLWESAEIEKRGGVKPKGIYDLRRRVERQEKKVEQATGSKIKLEEQPQQTEKQPTKTGESDIPVTDKTAAGQPIENEPVEQVRDISTLTIDDLDNPNIEVVAYHATPIGGIATGKDAGIHLGTEKAANTVKEGRNNNKGEVKKVTVKIKNPLVLDDMEVFDSNNLLRQLFNPEGKYYGIDRAKVEDIRNSDLTEKEKQQAIFDILKSKGFDGIVYENKSEDKGKPSIVVFDKSQIDITPEEKTNLQAIEKETGVNFREIQNVYAKYGEGKPLSEITKADFEKAQEKREKEAKKAKAEKTIDDVANWLKDKLKIDLPEGTKASGITQDDIIDLVAKAAKVLVNTGIELEAAIKQVVDSIREGGFLEGMDEATIQSSAKRTIKDETEEADAKRLRKHYTTIRDNTTVEADYKKFLDENKYAYTQFPNAELLRLAQEYIDENGVQKAIKDVAEGAIADGRVGIGVGYLLFKGLHQELGKAIKAGDEASADALMKDMESITDSLAKKGTDVGQQVQAFSLFTMMFEDAATTEYYYRKRVTQGNKKAKSNEINKKNAGNKAKKITKKAKKYIKEWASQVEKDLGGKPKRSGLSDLFKPDSSDKNNIEQGRKEFGGRLNDVTSIATLLADPKFRKYAKSVLKTVAYDTVKFAEEMVATLGDGAKKYLTELYNVGKEELDKEIGAKRAVRAVEAKIKRRQKEIAKKLIEGVEVKENENSLWGKYKQAAVNSIIQAGEKKISEAAGELPALQDFINQLTKNAKGFIKDADKKTFPSTQDPAAVLVHIVKNEEKYADLLSETILAIQEKYKNNPEKLIQLDAYFGQLFDKPFSNQTLSAVVKGELEKLSTSIADIAKRYYSEIAEAGGKIEESIQERLMQKFGLDEETAGDIAKQVEKRYKEMVSDRIAKDLKADIDRAVKNAQKTGEKIKPVDMLDRLVSAAMLGKLDADTIMDIFKHKYGVTTFTKEDSEFIAKQVERISKTEDQWRKAEETAKIIKYMGLKSPVYMSDVLHDLWYASVLSSAMLPIGTGEVNIGFNQLQVLNSAAELLPTLVMQKIRQRDNPENVFSATVGVWLNSLAQAVSQTKRSGNNTDHLVRIFSKNFLNESGTNFLTTLMYGSDSFTNFERPLEQTVMSEIEFKNLVKKSEAGDKKATKILRDAIVKVIGLANNTKYVGRMLAAQDMFFQGIIKNMWLIPIAREKFYNEGLRGEQLNEAVKNALYNTENELENAQLEALDDVIEFDYDIKENAGKFDVYRLGKKVKTFNTNAEAKIYIAEDAPKSIRYKRAVLEKLNKNSASEIIQRASKVAQNYVGTNVPTGGFGYVYRGILRAKGGVDEAAKKISAAGRAQNNIVKAGAFYGASYVVKNVNLILPFIKVPMNIAKLISDYGVLGAVRGYRGGNVFKAYEDEQITQAEKDVLYARAMVGASILIPFLVKILMQMAGDDDDRDSDNNKETLARYKELTGEDAQADNPIFMLPKEGDICGSLSFLSPSQKNFLQESGLAKEYCEFDGKSWVSILNKPKKFSLIFPATMNYYRRYVIDNPYFEGKPEDKQGGWGRAVASAVMAYTDAFLDISTMKGLASVTYKRTPEQRLISGAENILAPFKQIGNPAIERNIIKYWDGQARHWIDPTEDPKGYAETYIPFYGSYASVKNAAGKYGMLGEPIHQLPSEQQGVWTPFVAQARFWEENKPQRDMYAFLHMNGYMKNNKFPIKDYVNTEGKVENITKTESEELQRISGEKILSTLNSVKPELQQLANVNNDEFIKMVDLLISKSQEDTYGEFLKSKGFEMKKAEAVAIDKKIEQASIRLEIKQKAGFYE